MKCSWSGNVNPADPRLANIEQYKRLAAAIIESAAEDYVYAYRVGNKLEHERIERFFYSDEFILFSGGNLEAKAVVMALRHKAKWR